MKQAYRYTDNKSDRYWWIDHSETDLAINYGKTGTNGTFKVKEYVSPEQCLQSAQKLIAQKLKKGYVPDDSYDFLAQYFFDDIEVGLHPKTSHPYFNSAFNNDCYYDCGDEFAPFGSDEGYDTLMKLYEEVRQHKAKDKPLDFASFPVKLIEHYWGMTLIPPESTQLNRDKLKAQIDANSMAGSQIYQSDKVIIATAFGQIKITGRLDRSLQRQALLAFSRQELMAQLQRWDGDLSVMQKTRQDLQAFKTGG